MSDFNYQAYLRNNPLLQKEVKEEKLLTESQKITEGIPQESEIADYVEAMFNDSVVEKEGFQSDIWTKAEYAATSRDEGSVFMDLAKHLNSVGGKDVLEGNPDIKLELLPNGDIKWSADVTLDENLAEEETLNEGVLDKLKDKALKIVDKIRSKFSDVEVSKMKAAVKKALGKDKLELSDITLNNLKKVVNVMKDQLAEGQLEESLGDKIKKLAAGTGMLGGFAAAIAGMSLGTLSAPLVIGGLIAMIIGGMIGQDLDEEITEEATSKMTVSELKAKIKEDIISLLNEEEEEDVEAEIEDEVEVDVEEPAIDASDAQEGLTADEKEIQDSLKIAYDNAVAIGDTKLADQIGNSITFFTRTHVVER